MGIPLHKIPDIRRLYGCDPYGTSEIDFENTKQVPPRGHVIACRITAENPEEGFKPTSGSIQELIFRSTPNVWGYFSVQGFGGLHEFADSQFGHLFAFGAERDDARKSMVLALKELSIRGDIRTPVEYLINLLETPEFCSLAVHTGWLDELISTEQNQLTVSQEPTSAEVILTVLCGVVYKGYLLSKSRYDLYIQYLERGQVPPYDLLKVHDDIELILNNIKYKFSLVKISDNCFNVKLGNSSVVVEYRALSDGGILLVIDGKSHLVYGKEEALGLRLILKGKTYIFTKDYDPTNLRSSTAGKLIRYLAKNGTHIDGGTPYCEIEVMKMYMPLICPESGVITFQIPEGSVLAGGETIARLELDNPLTVKKATLFDQELPPLKPPRASRCKIHQLLKQNLGNLEAIMAGYPSESTAEHVENVRLYVSDQQLPVLEFSEILSIYAGRLPKDVDERITKILESYELGIKTLDSSIHGKMKFPAKPILVTLDEYEQELMEASQVAFRELSAPVRDLANKYLNGYMKSTITFYLARYIEIEKLFQGRQRDDVLSELRQQHKTDLKKVFDIALSRNTNSKKGEFVQILLNLIENEDTTEDYVPILHDLASLTGTDSIEVSVKARQLLIKYQLPSFKQRQVAIEECIRSAIPVITNEALKLEKLSSLIDQPASLFDVLVSFLNHGNAKVRELALEAYIRRSYRAYEIATMKYLQDKDLPRIEWEFNLPDPFSSASVSSNVEGKSFWRVESVDDIVTDPNNRKLRYGLMVVFDDLKELFDRFEEVLDLFIPTSTYLQNEPINVMNVGLLESDKKHYSEQELINTVAEFFNQRFFSKRLKDLGLRRITLVVIKHQKFPRYYTFRERLNYKEDPVCRHVEPPLAYHLELSRLSNFDITYIPTLNRQIHLYYATAKGKKPGDRGFTSAFFVRAVVRSGDSITTPAYKEYLIAQAERVMVDGIKSLEVAVRDKRFAGACNHHIFLKIITEISFEPDNVDELLRNLGEKYGKRLWKLKVGKLELVGRVKRGNQVTNLRFTVTNPTGYQFVINGFLEVKDSKTQTNFLSSILGPAPEDQLPANFPYPLLDPLLEKRYTARNVGTTYCYDFPTLFEAAIKSIWYSHQKVLQEKQVTIKLPRCFVQTKELILDENENLKETSRAPGLNDIGMVAWRMKLWTPATPQGREIILIANDITNQIGSFGPKEDALFDKASKLSRKEGLPRIYVACNSGARIELAKEVKASYKVKWVDPNDPLKGFQYLFVGDEDFEKFSKKNNVTTVGDDHRIVDIIGEEDGLGVENLRGSGLIAGETSSAYRDIFTITLVTGRTVGIGAYLVRLGQRTIQHEGPIILTGASAINKLLGKEVYSSNVQLGGTQIMFRNGVSHIDVKDDLKGVTSILNWLSYVPIKKGFPHPILSVYDPIDREIAFKPTPTPYDPVHMLAGYTDAHGHWMSGFFDQGSFTETLAGWARTVICGRARLGGIPIGVIAVETRAVESIIPADPATPESQEVISTKAGQVWYPDSAYKTAQAISDFNYGEELPLIIFANWRGFSGGMRDMFDEILKFGSYIVDNLREYKHPVFIYIPPNGELRGGAWVVLDPTINLDMMEMYCDAEGRGGVLEPNGTVEIKYRQRDLIATMHRLDSVLIDLDRSLAAPNLHNDVKAAIKTKITTRETELLQVYQQVATTFADLHDTPGRMKIKGVIRDVIHWKNARPYFYYRLRRKLQEHKIAKKALEVHPGLSFGEIVEMIKLWTPNEEVWNSDKEFISWSDNEANISDALNELSNLYLKKQLQELYQLNPKAFEDIVTSLKKKN